MMRDTLSPGFVRMTAVLFCCGCAGVRGTAAPVLEAIAPDSVIVAPGSVVEIVLSGSGFQRGTPGANTVRFGASAMRGVVASGDGRRITFVVPDAIESGGEAPPSRLIAGVYPVRVETPAGTSNVLMLRIYR